MNFLEKLALLAEYDRYAYFGTLFIMFFLTALLIYLSYRFRVTDKVVTVIKWIFKGGNKK